MPVFDSDEFSKDLKTVIEITESVSRLYQGMLEEPLHPQKVVQVFSQFQNYVQKLNIYLDLSEQILQLNHDWEKCLEELKRNRSLE